jgi:hypothetical protein
VILAGIMAALAIPGTWSQIIAGVNLVLLDGGDRLGSRHGLRPNWDYGPKTLTLGAGREVYEALVTAMLTLDPISIFIILGVITSLSYILTFADTPHYLLSLPFEILFNHILNQPSTICCSLLPDQENGRP